MAEILQFKPRPEPEATDPDATPALYCPCASPFWILKPDGGIQCANPKCLFVLPAVWDFDVSVDPEIHQ